MFKPQFAPLVAAGTKRQTIRPIPKRMPKVGDHESWREWTGKPYRSKTRKLAQVELTEVTPIRIDDGLTMKVGEVELGETDMSQVSVAHDDGFNTLRDMRIWFKKHHGLPFTGILIKSKDL